MQRLFKIMQIGFYQDARVSKLITDWVKAAGARA